jgi:hypothetical protein
MAAPAGQLLAAYTESTVSPTLPQVAIVTE